MWPMLWPQFAIQLLTRGCGPSLGKGRLLGVGDGSPE